MAIEDLFVPVAAEGRCRIAVTVDREHRRIPAAAAPPNLLLSAGGMLGAVAASSCCLLPLVLFGLGISGAWIGNLTRLAPYQPYFLGAAATCLGAGYWRMWRSRGACAAGEACLRRWSKRAAIAGLVVATVLVGAALALDLVAPLLLTS